MALGFHLGILLRCPQLSNNHPASLISRRSSQDREFSLLNGISFAASNLHSDNVDFPLSALQLEVFEAWRRPKELLGKSHTVPAYRPTMLAHGPVDLVQDITTDCSVVASLCAATARSERWNTNVTLDRLSCTSSWVDGILDYYSQLTPQRPKHKATDDVTQWKVFPSIAFQWLPSNCHHRRSSSRLAYIADAARD